MKRKVFIIRQSYENTKNNFQQSSAIKITLRKLLKKILNFEKELTKQFIFDIVIENIYLEHVVPCRYNLKLHGHSHSPNDSLIQMSRHIGRRRQFYFNGTRSVKGLIAMSQKPMWQTTEKNWPRLLGVWLFLIQVETGQLHRLVSPV